MHARTHALTHARMLSHSLYSSCLTMNLPFSQFRVFDQERNPNEFQLFASKLSSYDTNFFKEQHQCKNYQFFAILDIEYDLQSAKFFTIDFSAFPRKTKVQPDQLSLSQRNIFEAKKMSVSQNPRLVSSCQPSTISEFVENIFFAAHFLGLKIVSVRKIVRFKSYHIFRDYITTLNEARAKESSKISNQVFKSLSNCLAG